MIVSKINKVHSRKTYTGADVLAAARKMMKAQMEQIKGGALTDRETKKVDQVSSGISFEVLKQMGVV